MALTADFIQVGGPNLPKGPHPWHRGGANNHSSFMGNYVFPLPNGNQALGVEGHCENNRSGAVMNTVTGELVGSRNQPHAFGTRFSPCVTGSGATAMLWFVTRDHKVRGHLLNEYGRHGEEVGVYTGSFAVNHFHGELFAQKHSDGTQITFANSWAQSNAISAYPDAMPGYFELKQGEQWEAVPTGQDMDLASRGNVLVLAYRQYHFQDRVLVNGARAPIQQRKVNYIKYLNAANGQTIGGTTAKIDMNGTFGGLTLSGDVKGICVDTDGNAVVIVGNSLVKVTPDGVRTLIASNLPNPWRIDADANHYFVSCHGDQRVHVITKSGTTVATLGRNGGRLMGPHVPTDFKFVTDISADGTGGFWATEMECPRACKHISGTGALIPVKSDGATWEEYYGGGIWTSPVTANPNNPLEVLFGYTRGAHAVLRMKRPTTPTGTGTFKVISNHEMLIYPGFVGGGKSDLIWHHINGVDYFARRGGRNNDIWKYNRETKQMLLCCRIEFETGKVIYATDAACTTYTTNTYNTVNTVRFGQTGQRSSLDYYMLTAAGPLKKFVATIDPVTKNPNYNLNNGINVWEWDSLSNQGWAAGDGFTTGDANAANAASTGWYEFATGHVSVGSDSVLVFHQTQTGAQKASFDPWGKSQANRIYRWNPTTKAFLGRSGQTTESSKTGVGMKLTSWNNLPSPPEVMQTGRSFLITAIRDNYRFVQAVQGGWLGDTGGGTTQGPALVVMVDKNGVFTRGPLENRVVGPDKRAKADWWYTGSTEWGNGDVLEDKYTGKVAYFMGHEGEFSMVMVDGPEFDQGRPTTLAPYPPDDDAPVTPPPVDPPVPPVIPPAGTTVKHPFLSNSSSGGVLTGLRRGGKRVRLIR